MSETRIKITMVHGKNTIEIESKNIDEILELLSQTDKIKTKLSESSLETKTIDTEQGAATSVPATSLSEIVAVSKAETISDKLLMIVHEQWKQGAEELNIKDLNTGLKSIGEPTPSNIGPFMDNMVSKGLVARGGEKNKLRTWKLTSTGKNRVEKELMAASEGAQE